MTKIQLRRGNASDWTDANSVLSEGEVGLELDTGKFKWGDGTTAWNDLAYIGGGAGPVALLKGDIAVGFGQNAGQQATLDSSALAELSIQGPPLVVAASGVVCEVESSHPADVPDISGPIDVYGLLYVTDQTGDNTLTVNGTSSQSTPISGGGLDIDWTDSSPTIVGDDLTWDDVAATVHSTSGGIYSVTLLLTCGPPLG